MTKRIKTGLLVLASVTALTACKPQAPALPGSAPRILEIKTDEVTLSWEPAETPPQTVRQPVQWEYPEGVKGIEMVLVEGGSMEIQGQTVTLDSFYMNRYELTVYVEKEVHNWAFRMGYLDSTGLEWPHYDFEDPEPAIMMFYDTLDFCNFLSMMENLEPVYYYMNENGDRKILLPFDEEEGFDILYVNYGANGYRLPTEAEWEYAARGGQQSRGFVFAGSDNIDEVAWYYGNDDHEFHTPTGKRIFGTPVGQKLPNELGLYDMSGNASEWCIDPYIEPANMEPKHNPGRIVEYSMEYRRDNHWLQKGGYADRYGRSYAMDRDIKLLTPQARIPAMKTHEPMPGLKAVNRHGTIRLVRNGA
jgi:formylglycine-generating enzyme required for sulfatase activity